MSSIFLDIWLKKSYLFLSSTWKAKSRENFWPAPEKTPFNFQGPGKLPFLQIPLDSSETANSSDPFFMIFFTEFFSADRLFSVSVSKESFKRGINTYAELVLTWHGVRVKNSSGFSP